MATAVQVQYRRDSAANVAAFTGAAGEMVIDTTNNRVVVQDGATAGGFPAAKLSEVVTNIRTQVSDGNYTAQPTDRTIAYIALTASRVVSLPAASSFPGGTRLLVIDESGNCGATKTITLSAAGSDLVDGASSAVIGSAYGYLAVESNTANKWTIVDQPGGGGGVSALNSLTGALTIVANDGDVVTASGSTVTLGGPGGMVNKFRNGTMDVWQRGTAPSLTAGTSGSQYTADGWIVAWTASASAAPAVAQMGGRLTTKNCLQVTGATYITDMQIIQRIESLIAAAFCSQTVTVQAQVYNGTGASITPTLTVKRPNTQDGWSGTVTTDVNAVGLQACASGQWTQVAYTFSANAASYDGLEIVFDFGNNFGANTKTVSITECDIRVTPGVATGLNSNPPPPELRPIAVELAFSQRYFSSCFPNGTAPADGTLTLPWMGFANSTTVLVTSSIFFTEQMRAAPTMTFYKFNSGGTNGEWDWWNGSSWIDSSTTVNAASAYAFTASLTTTGLTSGNIYKTNGAWSASAEL